MKYRKKPIVIEAFQTDKEVTIETLEGKMKANIGDYIITGVNGEKYPCKPEIFEKTYEQVDIQPELTTAEKLLWLVENVKAVCIFECDFGHLGIRLDLPRNKFKIFTTNDEVKNRDMLIDKVYKWAKEEK